MTLRQLCGAALSDGRSYRDPCVPASAASQAALLATTLKPYPSSRVGPVDSGATLCQHAGVPTVSTGKEIDMTITRRQLTLSAIGSGFMTGCGTMPTAPAVMEPDRLARIAPALRNEVERGIFPGAVSLIAHRGQTVHHEAVGFIDAAKTRPMPRDAIFRLASMTKPIVSVATMMLVEQGRLKINDSIFTWLPELKDVKVETPTGDVPLVRAITVQDLLAHTAGLVYGPASPSERIKKMYADLNISAGVADLPGDEMLKRLGTIPLLFQPGTTWSRWVA